MSLESYAVHIAPRGGKIDLIVDQIAVERQAASDARLAYSQAKGAIGSYQSESSVSGLLFKENAALPEGWAKQSYFEGGIIAVPKAKDRTKVARDQVKAIKAELAALPRLPGAMAFTSRIGGNQVIIPASGGSGFAMASCFYERIGETTFVFTPWATKRAETGNLDDDNTVKTAFHPEGCERVGLSAYYAAKEAVSA
jgi:hypothetical protein